MDDLGGKTPYCRKHPCIFIEAHVWQRGAKMALLKPRRDWTLHKMMKQRWKLPYWRHTLGRFVAWKSYLQHKDTIQVNWTWLNSKRGGGNRNWNLHMVFLLNDNNQAVVFQKVACRHQVSPKPLPNCFLFLFKLEPKNPTEPRNPTGLAKPKKNPVENIHWPTKLLRKWTVHELQGVLHVRYVLEGWKPRWLSWWEHEPLIRIRDTTSWCITSWVFHRSLIEKSQHSDSDHTNIVGLL